MSRQDQISRLSPRQQEAVEAFARWQEREVEIRGVGRAHLRGWVRAEARVDDLDFKLESVEAGTGIAGSLWAGTTYDGAGRAVVFVRFPRYRLLLALSK